MFRSKVTGLLLIILILCAGMASALESGDAFDNEVVEGIYDLEVLFREQQCQLLPGSLPSEQVLVPVHAPVVPVDWKKFPAEFTSLMYAQMDADGYPVYKVSIYADPVTGDTVFLNAYGTEACRLSPEANYDPYVWQTDHFGLDVGEEFDPSSLWKFDPAHLAFDYRLIPELFHEDYLATHTEAASLEATAIPMEIRSLQVPVTNLQMAISTATNGSVELEVGWPASFTNDLEIFATTGLLDHVWHVVFTDITTSSSTNFLWTDWSSTNTQNRFYMASNAEVDSDEDGLADGIEAYVYGSNPDRQDSDDDGLNDNVEVESSPPTDPSDGDRQAPVITITVPVNSIVAVP